MTCNLPELDYVPAVERNFKIHINISWEDKSIKYDVSLYGQLKGSGIMVMQNQWNNGRSRWTRLYHSFQ